MTVVEHQHSMTLENKKQNDAARSGRSPPAGGSLIAVGRFLLGLLHHVVHLRTHSQHLFLRAFLETAGGRREGTKKKGAKTKKEYRYIPKTN